MSWLDLFFSGISSMLPIVLLTIFAFIGVGTLIMALAGFFSLLGDWLEGKLTQRNLKLNLALIPLFAFASYASFVTFVWLFYH